MTLLLVSLQEYSQLLLQYIIKKQANNMDSKSMLNLELELKA